MSIKHSSAHISANGASANGNGVALADAPTARSIANPKAKSAPYQFLEALASLRLTVVLFSMSLLLVFWGTWAQVDAGIWTVVNQYFRSPFVMVPMRTILFNVPEVGSPLGDIRIPYPGGWLAERDPQLASQSIDKPLPDHSWFAGYLPRERPSLAFAVLLEHTGQHGGDACVPVLADLLYDPAVQRHLAQATSP